MNRRTLLAGTGIALSVGLVGCLGGGFDAGDGEDDDADGMSGGTDDPIQETPRVDEPPYPIDRPDPPDEHDESDWNDDYLGEAMPTDPSLSFDRVTGARGLAPGLTFDGAGVDRYRADLIKSETALDTLLDDQTINEDARDRLDAVDFEEAVLVIVASGFGSGSVGHRWGRVEAAEDGLQLHGYYTDPHIQTDDVTYRASVIEVERPDGAPDLARVSLTVGTDRRVHFNSTEGVVSVDPE